MLRGYGMTRSDDPFGDLPEWKERQRLQEAQEQAGGQPPGYQQPGSFSHMPTPQHQLPHGGGHGDPGAMQQAPDAAAYYHQEPSLGAPSLHYNVASDGHSMSQDGFEPQLQNPSPFQHQGPDAQPNGLSPQTYANQGHVPLDYGNAPIDPHADPRYGPSEGQYDPSAQYQALGGAAPAHAAAGYGSGHLPGGGQPGVGPNGEPAFYDPANGEAGMDWQADQVGAAAPHQSQVGYDDEYDDDEDDYYDDELDDDRQRYSWKMMAAVVVTGAVVTGGGVVLYDSFVGGGSGGGGKAPIIRADQAPAKTAPVNSGGRQFGNRDSKLLGRLDNSNGTKTTRALDDANGTGNRVRSVPTVRIGRDGRLILPKAPEAVAAPETGDKKVAAASGDRIAPGINVVESIGSNGASGLGGVLPPAVPQPAATPQVTNASTPAAPVRRAATPQVKVPPQRTQPAAPAVKPLNQTPVVTAARSGGTTNRAIVPKSGPPPVPAKSSLGTAWRSTSANTTARAPVNTGAIRPTIAQPVQWQAKPAAQTASRAAPKLGAGNVASTQNRKYVAVLATAPTRMKALQSFAELQQKHPNALLNKVPDVQRADLSARGLGIMYRVVVGPAGSRSSASSVCSSLKSEGYKGCWVKNN